MKLKRAYIYGFGKWIDKKITFPQTNFICLFGYNESGKSTLKNFFKFMLFGLPPKDRKFYYPKISSRMGGQLTVVDERIGKFTIERIDGMRNGEAKCLFPDGKERDESWLQSYLQGMDSFLYDAIFSFSTQDLQQMKYMKSDDLGEILLNLALSGYQNIHDVERQLQRKLNQLFKPYGIRPVINEQINQLHEYYQNIKELEKEVQSYREMSIRFDEIQHERKHLQKSLQTKQRIYETVNKRWNHLPTIVRYVTAQYERSLLPEEISFPKHGLERYQSLKDKLLPLRSEYLVAEENVAHFQKLYQEEKNQSLDSVHYELGEQLLNLKQTYERYKDYLQEISESLSDLQTRLKHHVEQLQVKISKDDLVNLTLPFHIEEEWNDYKQRDDYLQKERTYYSEQHKFLQRQKEILIKEQKQSQQKLLSEERKRKYEKELRLSITEQDYEKMKQKIEKKNEIYMKKNKQRKFSIVCTIIFASLFIVLANIFNQSFFRLGSILIMILGMGYWLIQYRSMRDLELIFRHEFDHQNSQQVLSERKKDNIEHLLHRDEEATRSLQALEKEMRINQSDLLEVTNKLAILEKEEEKLARDVAKQRERYPFLQDVQVAYWPKMFYEIRKMIDMANEEVELKRKKNDYLRKIDNIFQKLTSFIEEIDSNQQFETTYEMFHYIEHIIDRQRERKYRMRQLSEQLKREQNQKEELSKKIMIYQKEVDQLFAMANVASEEEFYEKSQLFRQQKQLEKDVMLAKQQLSTVFTEREIKQLIHLSLDKEELKERRDYFDRKIKSLQQQIDEKRDEEANILAHLSNLEASDTFSETYHRYAREKERLHELALEWAKYMTAYDLLTETKKNYHQTYLAKVLHRTTAYFQTLTDGAYIRIFPPSDKYPFQVECKHGIRYAVHELSQGTIDQLYVSLRIAMGVLMSGKYRIPFIIDDAFVHFDINRLEKMIDIIQEIADNHQVIFFTCKQDVIDLLDEQDIIYLDEQPALSIK